MAPKKKDAGADVLQDGPAEEEEPGSGKVVFSFSAQGVKDLPGELQTLVGFSGFCKEFRTNASPEPSGWEFTKETVIRLQNQDLYNDMVERPLVVSLRDAAADNAPIGTGEISLVPLLHDATEVSLDLELKLAPDYYAKWWKDDEADDPKKKDKNKAPAEPAKEREPLFEGDAPPPTILTVSVKVEDLVGPMEDRECWTILTLGMEGVFALPEALTSLGVTSPDDFQAHPISYKTMLLGEPFGEGLLTKAAEERSLMEMLESGELDLEELEEEEAVDDDDMDDEEQAASSSAWANGQGPDGMGCTAVVALVRGGGKPEVFCANAGDSRCVLARGERAKNMSRDHKPELKSERNRIYKAGGFVSPDGRVDGNLNLSRSLGDFAYKKDKSRKAVEQKISAEAEVKREALGPADKFLAIGCDGIFEKVSSQELVTFLLPHIRSRRRKDVPLSSACSAFLDRNLAKNPQKDGGLGCDNMTLMVIELQSQQSQCRQAMPSPSPRFSKALPPSSRRRRVMKRQIQRKSKA